MNQTVLKLKKTLVNSINRGHQRSVKAKKHILASFLIKGTSILTGFLMVPLTIGYVEKEQYGIWLTLSSVVAWFSFFDIGLGHGLRNKLAESLAKKDMLKAKIYVSSTYAILTIVFTLVLLVFFAIQPFLNWQSILNTDLVGVGELRLVAIVTFSFFCINFVLKLIFSIFLADQRPANQGLINLISNVTALLIIFLLTKTTQGSLFYLALAIGLSPMVILLGASLYMFLGEYREITPSIHYVNIKEFKDLMGLGVKFFFIQVSSIIIFSTDNLIITQIYGPAEVPSYAVAHKYFHLITSIFAIITVPFWSAYTEAYLKKDIQWITSTNRRLIKTWAVLVGFSLVMLLFSNFFYRIWVPEIEVPFRLSLMMCLYVNVLTWGSIFVMFINGVGKVQLQMITSFVSMVINIPLSYFLAVNCNLGTAGVILASTISIAYGPILGPIQFHKIVKGTATGIWNR